MKLFKTVNNEIIRECCSYLKFPLPSELLDKRTVKFQSNFMLCTGILLLWLGSSQLLENVTCKEVLLLGTRVPISDSARDLGIIIDRELSLEAHVTAVCRAGYNQLRQLRSVVRSLSVHATKTLVQAFTSCRLDYCNSLLYGINDGLLRRLQSV